MEFKFKDISHSTPVEEIMGNPPASIVRWGTSVFAVIFVLVIAATWYIKLPYVVYGTAEITTENPPANLVARVSGKIEKLMVNEGDQVRRGDVLAIMESTASYESIIWLSTVIDSVRVERGELSRLSGYAGLLPDRPDLGELQEYYSGFRKAYFDFNNHVAIDIYGRRTAALLDEIDNIDRYIVRLNSAEKLYIERHSLEYKKYLRDSSLYNEKVYSLEALEESRKNYLKIGIELENVRLDRVTKEIERSSRMQEVQELVATGEEEKERYRSLMEEAYMNLTARLDWWYQNWLLQAPIDGRVTFNKYWGENQVATEGETIMTVVPGGENRMLARVTMSVKGSGKVEQGQVVYIKLNGYPYLEYGMLQGIVASKSLAATENGYIVDVNLPDTLVTFYGKELEFSQKMPGTAEIITEDMRLIERVIYPFRFIIEKNRRR